MVSIPQSSIFCRKNVIFFQKLSELFVHYVLRRTFDYGLYVVCSSLHNSLTSLFGCPGDVRGNDAVLSFQKYVVSFDRLSRNNIKTSSINLPTIQSICQILLNNKLTTAVVDKDNSILLPLFAGTITSPG